MSTTSQALSFLDEGLQGKPLFEKACEILDYLIAQAKEDRKDFTQKLADPSAVPIEVVNAGIHEYGFDYILDVANTLQGVDTTVLYRFASLVALMKGHRLGLEVVFLALGMSAVIHEWWEYLPPKEEMTFDMDVFVDLSAVINVFDVLDKIRLFTKRYVFPELKLVTANFDVEMVTTNLVFYGFRDRALEGDIVGTL